MSRDVRELGEVLADAEAAARAGDHDGAYVRGLCLPERLAQRAVHRRVERVQLLGPVERDRQHRAGAGGLDLGHQRPLNSG